jgi:hypothetical protein
MFCLLVVVITCIMCEDKSHCLIRQPPTKIWLINYTYIKSTEKHISNKNAIIWTKVNKFKTSIRLVVCAPVMYFHIDDNVGLVRPSADQ